ncbi:HEAT repeat protein [Anatilimnocola aggregata]|uniref:HEAT repeat protein n=1 Tax=Anatilimnocola aggregata TaxID=2528021 RepID=A0A517Y705_9BACT|nr:HEAT repeat domain-containing protein [Anatilimnocola aggregata]QDU26013.1 HEAT repeat protein [Anatilimnocola aggregata]
MLKLHFISAGEYRWFAASLLAGSGLLHAGCGYDPYPTPKPVRTPGIQSSLDGVQRATYETSLTTGAAPTVPAPVMEVYRPQAPEIIPFEQWTEQQAAADALGRIGQQAIPYLQQALRSPDPQIKIQAAEVLARMGSDAKSAVNDLVPLLDDPDPEVRKVATRTLGRIGPDAAAAIPALMRSLVQPEPLPPAPAPAPTSGSAPGPLTEPRLLPRQ